MIRLAGLRVAYGRTIALDCLELELRAGVTGVFGPNGSGKSTLLRVLAGLLRPTAGTATLEGTVISASDEAFRRRVGFAGHEPGLYPRLSVAENLALFARLHGARERRVDAVLEELGLAERRDTLAGTLSAGLKRRTSVARALLHEPDLLLLDEPYANLDDDASELVSGAIRRWRAPGRAALIATHGAKKVKRFADAGLILKDGAAVVYGAYAYPRAGPNA